MIFISDVHHKVEFLEKLPKNKGPVVILGDLINWIDYRNGEGIARDVFGLENVLKLIEYRKQHLFEKRKLLWSELYANNPVQIQKKMNDAIDKQYNEVFKSLKNFEVWFIPGNVDDLHTLKNFESEKIKNVDNSIVGQFIKIVIPRITTTRTRVAHIHFPLFHKCIDESIMGI